MSAGVSLTAPYYPPSPSTGFGSRRVNLSSTHIALPRLPGLKHDVAVGLVRSGLRTPPVEDMSITYESMLPSHDSHAMHAYPTSMAHVGRSRTGFNDTRSSQYYRYPSQHQQQLQNQPQQQQAQVVSQSQPRNGSLSWATQPAPTSQYSTQASTPGSGTIVGSSKDGSSSRRGSETLVFHSLQMPKVISETPGNLADFAAQMTCLFWFESTENLKQAESILTRSTDAPIARLPALAKPFDQFRKWVYSVLSTTQVTQNVILLALLFIYRLKMLTPQIKGRAGSEYRLLTVALMLGNKFLDDNTYTNKTWAEVSCFNVQEIHVMEVEFLSNMRYNLTATTAQWEEWLGKLACFYEYYDRASRLPASPILVTSPNAKGYNSPIPSPTGNMSASVPSLPVTPTHSQNWSAYQANAVSPLATKPSVNFPVVRKRGLEEEIAEHPAKRTALARPPLSVPAVTVRPSNGIPEAARLPPRLTLVTEQAQNIPAQYAPTSAYTQPPQQLVSAPQAPLSLPPLQHGVRAMSTVYQPTPVSMVQQAVLPATTAAAMASANFTSHAPMHFGTPNKHHGSGALAPYNSSPLLDAHLGGQGVGVHTPIVHTPISNSPSVYLQQRPSPYKPVRHVNTLLYPPPSASLDQYHLSVPVQASQMHYQPLGRRHDLRTGIVPEFLVYNRGNQHPGLPQGPPQGHYPS